MLTLKRFFAFILILITGFPVFSQQYTLTRIWETDSTLKVPESVLFDRKARVLYVSNIDGDSGAKDGKGSIGKVGVDGKIIAGEWVTGLHAPKGMALYKNNLFVADVDAVVVIDTKKGIISKRIPVEGAVFLNDLSVNKQGVIFVTDSRTSKVHKIENDVVSLFLENLKNPNGILVQGKEIYILNSGEVLKADRNGKIQKVAEGLESRTDGIEQVKGKDFIVSCWSGVVYYVKADGSSQQLLDTREQKINSADIGYDKKNRIVYVPTFFKNSVVAYQLSK